MDCLFCKIVDGKIPAMKFYETENFMAFLDINPRTKGHCLVIPKAHYQTFDELPEEYVFGLFKNVRKVSDILKEKLGATGFNIFINNGKSAGQVIPHVHVHIMPRYQEGGPSIEAPFPVREDIKAELKDIQALLEK